jgi:hypothetical protein
LPIGFWLRKITRLAVFIGCQDSVCRCGSFSLRGPDHEPDEDPDEIFALADAPRVPFLDLLKPVAGAKERR